MATDQTTGRRGTLDEQRAAEIGALLRSEPLPLVQKSIDAFRRDLPDLLKRHRGQFAAYHGDARVGLGRSETQLYRDCFRQGLIRDEFVVCGIEEWVFDPDEKIEASRDT